MEKFKRPDDLPGRVCRVLEGITASRDDSPFSDMVYRFTHIASERCTHKGWMAEFITAEAEIEESFYTSPAEKEARNKLDTDR